MLYQPRRMWQGPTYSCKTPVVHCLESLGHRGTKRAYGIHERSQMGFRWFLNDTDDVNSFVIEGGSRLQGWSAPDEEVYLECLLGCDPSIPTWPAFSGPLAQRPTQWQGLGLRSWLSLPFLWQRRSFGQHCWCGEARQCWCSHRHMRPAQSININLVAWMLVGTAGLPDCSAWPMSFRVKKIASVQAVRILTYLSEEC